MADLSLAPWSYRRLLRQGPGNQVLRRLTVREVSTAGTEGSGFEAYAYLRDGLRPVDRPKLYGDADGTGFARLGVEACHKAISEALERWCFFATVDSAEASLFGFDRESTTLGMAAYPWLTAKPARDRAHREAVERWSVAAWWEGRLAARPLDGHDRGSGVARLIHPWHMGEVVLVWGEVQAGTQRLSTFGFSCGRSIEEALRQARAEQRRNREALRKLETGVDATSIGSLFERRLLYFASPEGRAAFDARLQASLALDAGAGHRVEPALLVDREIRGPWSRYARVWRCLFEMPSRDHLSERLDYFLF